MKKNINSFCRRKKIGFWSDVCYDLNKKQNIVGSSKTKKEKDQKIPIRSHTHCAESHSYKNKNKNNNKIYYSLSSSSFSLRPPRIAIPATPSLSDSPPSSPDSSLRSAVCRLSLRRRWNPCKIPAALPRDFSRVFWSFVPILLPGRRFSIALTLCSVHEPSWLPGVDAERTKPRQMATWVWAILCLLRSRASPRGLLRSHSLPSTIFLSSKLLSLFLLFCSA